jgi:hypothetical protein
MPATVYRCLVRCAVMLVGLLAACARLPAPKDPETAPLFRDLERQVTVADAAGWGIDRIEIDGMLDNAMLSACRVDALSRQSLLGWLDDRIAATGGPVEAAWRARGKRLGKVEDLLILSRIRLLLRRAEATAGDCPFWLEPQHPFKGRQISDGHWQISFGGGGKGVIVRRGDSSDVRAGGAGRLLFGRVLAGGNAIYAGVEVGANASFPRDATGERTALVLGVDVVAPVVYRITGTNAYFEIEGGWLGHATERDWRELDHGMHVGVAVGARALRTRFVFPGAAIGISYERLFLAGDDLSAIKFGARVAFDLDL